MGTPGDHRNAEYIEDLNALSVQAKKVPQHASIHQLPTTPSASTPAALAHEDAAAASPLLPEIKIETTDEVIIDGFYPLLDEVAGPSGLQTPTNNSVATNCAPAKKLRTTIKKQYVCSECQKCFQNLSRLTKHEQAHSNGSPFKCEHCKKSFSSKFKLVRHMLIHSDRKPFSCTICERTFHRKDHLKNHIKVHSPYKKLYVCDKQSCKKEYTSLISYKKHLAFHAADDGQLDCLICDKSFKSKEEILYHLKVHAGSRTVKHPDEKKYSCDHCQRKFFTRKDVRRHMVVHTGRRDFLCQFCPQRFGRKDHLVRHIKKSHSRNLDECDAGANVKVEVIDPEDEPTVVVKTEVEAALHTDDDTVEEMDGSSNLSNAECFDTGLGFDALLPLDSYLSSPHAEEELADLGCEVLDVIPDAMDIVPPGVVAATPGSDVQHLQLPETIGLEYLQDVNAPVGESTPLPAFSQIFQQQLPPPPPDK